MPDLRDDEIAIGEHLGVELDHRVPFVAVIRSDARVKRQVIVKPRRTEVFDAAADVNPRPELYVLQQREIGEAQDLASAYSGSLSRMSERYCASVPSSITTGSMPSVFPGESEVSLASGR